MGTQSSDTMQTGALALALVLVLASVNVDGRSFDAGMVRRGLSDPNDPRNLFNSIYGINYKRVAPREQFRADEDLPGLFGLYMDQAYEKRGLRDPNDPRNLFRAIYGYRK